MKHGTSHTYDIFDIICVHFLTVYSINSIQCKIVFFCTTLFINPEFPIYRHLFRRTNNNQ